MARLKRQAVGERHVLGRITRGRGSGPRLKVRGVDEEAERGASGNRDEAEEWHCGVKRHRVG